MSILLTDRQQEVLVFIREYTAKHKCAPRLDEIANHFDVKPPTAHKILEALQQNGYILFGRDNITGFYIRLIERAGTDASIGEIPVVGSVDRNGEIHDITKKIGHIVTVLLLSRPEDLFAVHVTAQIPEAALTPHDLIICDQGRASKPRNLCIALINGRLLLVDILAQDSSTGELEWQPLSESAFALEGEKGFPEVITPDHILATVSRMTRYLAF